MKPVRPGALSITTLLAAMVIAAAATAPAWGQPQVEPAKAAQMVLDSGRRAYNERKYDFAAERFREYIKQYPESAGLAAAQYGLAMSLLEAPQRNYKAIGEALTQAVRGNLPERAYATYYLGVAMRAIGEEAAAKAGAKPDEKAQGVIRSNYQESARFFGAAGDAFLAAAKPAATPPAAGAAPDELDWAIRARCDQCEMLLRLKAFPEAEKLVADLLGNPLAGKGRYHELALYLLGYARFAQNNYLEAGKALSQLAPFQQDFGVHARYLLGRTHHLAGERPEAAAQYDAVLAGYEATKKKAADAMKAPQAVPPAERATMEALLREGPPDYVQRATFHAAQLQLEAGKYDEALKRFQTLLQQNPKFAMAGDAQLRIGYCLLQVKKFPEAIAAFQPLQQDPALGDQAMWWTGRTQIAAADPANAQAYQAALAAGIASFRQAADRAGALAKNDADAKARRGDILLELADAQQGATQYKEAAETYRMVANERQGTDRAEEATQRLATVLNLAGQYEQSDNICRQFESNFPRSTLLPGVLFRSAENAYFMAMAVYAKTDPATREQQLGRVFGEAIRRYQRLMEYSSDFQYANLARYGLATLYYRSGQFQRAEDVLSAIPDAERKDDLAGVPYLLADCMIRTVPNDADDAVTASRLVGELEEAAKLLEIFLGAQPKGPDAPDALLKLGHCYQRMAEVITDPTERRKVADQARAAYERITREFAQTPAGPVAILERAQSMALMGDPAAAVNELKKFQAEPLSKSAAAPLAMVRLARLMRTSGQAPAVVKMLEAYRTQQEAALLEDPTRKDLVAMVQYEHALALRESNNRVEAVKIFDALQAKFPGRPEAINAVWCAGQCRREDLTAQLVEAQRAATRGGMKPEDLTAANQKVQEILVGLRQAVGPIHAMAENVGRTTPGSAVHQRLLYEAAWGYRSLGDAEIENARQAKQAEALRQARAALAKATPAGQPVPEPAAGDVAASQVPVQPSEMLAQAMYERIIAVAPDSAMAVQARMELAEMYAQRNDSPANIDTAVKLLTDALAKAPPKQLAELIRIRLAGSLLARKDAKGALAQLAAIGEKPVNYQTPPLLNYLSGEAQIQLGDWAKAAEKLVPFRDNPNFRNAGGIADRALLRLAEAYAATQQWEPSRAVLAMALERNKYGPWVDEAYFAMGTSLQKQKRYDEAVKAYIEVIRRTVCETAARAQFQIGLCRLEQSQFEEAARQLLVVPLTYGYPQWSAAARCEAARAYEGLKNNAEAIRLYNETLKDQPTGPWADQAHKRLAELSK